MVIHITDDFDLDKIADSGQCFRWEKLEVSSYDPEGNGNNLEENCDIPRGTEAVDPENTGRSSIVIGMAPRSYRIIAGESCLYITSLGDGRYELDCTGAEFNSFWHEYFDLEENYRRIRERIDSRRDPFLWQASEHEKGIRILQQDPWEMLITSIITQNRNIPAIRRSVELLSQSCGEKKKDRRGRIYYAFPGPETVAGLSGDALNDCRLGYRCRYVHAAAEAVAGGKIDLDRLIKADEKTTIAELTGLFGVGVKVASCVSLFGLHHLDAFPVDVWMKRILAQEYADGYPYEEYSPYNGIYQQYMFAWYRHRGVDN